MCVSLVCVLVLFRASVCAFRVSELLVVRLSFVVKLFLLRCVSCEIPKFSCRVLKSNFRVVFWIRLFRFVALFDFSNFVALFDFSNLTLNSSSNSTSRISCRISNSNLSSKFVVEIFVSLLYSTSRSSSFRFEFRIRLFRFVALFDFSNFDSKVSLLYSTSRNRSSNSISRISSFRFKCLEFRIRLDLFDFSNCRRKFRCSIQLLEFRFAISIRKFRWSSQVLEVVFFIWVLNWTLQFSSKFDDYQCYSQLTSSIILALKLSLRSRCHSSFARAFRA